MEILFYTSLLIPLTLALIALFLDKDYGKSYLKINKYVYSILALLATYFWIK
jgi:uncharacterized membrane protein YwaF